ncbi:MAG: hypothetical protein M3014_09260 [Chloroflexota bacterium]|nr:hypothetical protein [Chloroflexota bacterium]
MSRGSRSTYSSAYTGYGRRDAGRHFPSPLPYLFFLLVAALGLIYFHYFAYSSLSGKVVNSYTGTPMAGVPVLLEAGGSAGRGATPQARASVTMTATTGPDGLFHFDKIPAAPVISVAPDGFTPQRVEAGERHSLEFLMLPDRLSGQVLGADGKGIQGAALFGGQTHTFAGANGAYVLKDLPQDRTLVVKAPGYLATTVQFGQVITKNVTLQPFIAKAVYLSADTIATPAKFQSILDMLDKTELNALVIDVKADSSGQVLYDSRLQVVQDLHTANKIIPDLDALIAQLKAKKIYLIARLPLYSDQALTNARPEWALKSKKTPGQVWLDAFGKRWANPYNPQVWDYNLAIAKEVAQRGFNEVQFDGAEFPSQGDLEDIDYGPTAVGKHRIDGVAGFLDHAYTELSPLGVYIADDVFALTPYVQDDMGVGQHFEDIAARVDYICPAIYPSSFADGFMGFPKPAERPSEIVGQTARSAAQRVQGGIAKVRPWLQDFSGKVAYDPAKVRAEIDAAEQNGAVGWMLWNFGNVYSAPALKGP